MDEQQLSQLDPAVRELLTKAQVVEPDIPALAPEDLNEQAAARQQSEFARRYLSRDIDAESRQRSREELPKNRVLRALLGMGEGVRKYNDPKFETAEERTYNRMMNEYAKQAPVLQRDLSAFESTNARMDAKRQDLALKTAKAKNEFNLGMQGVLQKYAVQIQRDPALRQKVLESVSKTKNLDATTRLRTLEGDILEATGAKAGTATPDAVNATLQMSNPALAEQMRKNDWQGVLQGGMKTGLGRLIGGGGAGGRTTTTVSRPQTLVDGPDGKKVIFTKENVSTRTSGGGGDPAAMGKVLNFISDQINGQQTVPPAGAEGGVRGLPLGGAPQGGASLGSTPTPVPSGGGAIDRLFKREPAAPAVNKAAPLGQFQETNIPMKGEKEKLADIKLSEQFSSSLKMARRLSNNLPREQLQAIAGPLVGSKVGSFLRETFGDDRSQMRQYENTLRSSLVRTQWLQALELSGKALNGREQDMAKQLFGRLNDNFNGITSKPGDLVNNLVLADLMMSVMRWKMQDLPNRRDVDLTPYIVAQKNKIFNMWAAGEKAGDDMFEVSAMIPGVAGDATAATRERLLKRARERK